MCASRGRPGYLYEAMDSVLSSSSSVDVCVYLDEDDAWRYGDTRNGVRVINGPRIGHCLSLDAMVRSNPGYSAYAVFTDDMRYTTKGWDEWVLETVSRAPAGLAAIAPKLSSPVGCDTSGRMDLPCLSGGWVDLFGRFCLLDAEFYYWDIAIQVVADHTRTSRYAQEDEFSVHHLCLMESYDLPDAKEALRRKEISAFHDSRNTCVWMQDGRREAIRKIEDRLRKVMR